jgi:hypothetical protein
MKQFAIKMGQVFILTIFLASACTGIASASEERGLIRSDASEAQLELINELHGQDITVLEYMEKVHPEHLVGVSDLMKENMASQRMNWWGKEPLTDEKSKADRATVSVTATGYTADWRTIHFGGSCAASGLQNPPWYIYAEAFLIDRDTGKNADSTAASSRNVWSVSAPKDKLYPDNGQYYVHAWGYIPTPYYAEDYDDTGVFNFP